MSELRQHALDAGGARLVFLGELGAPDLELARQAVESLPPTVLAADHGGVDEQLLPAPRRDDGAGDDFLGERVER
ncbi:MAG: hypothetical protein B6D46_10160 [Polyangiaceae bacterium UTPRO1]|nr:MAG: hypothetical protein B6D46_10160 [Polyangiaceae bacterium UTPRO1]